MNFKAIRAGLKLVWVTVFVTLSVSVTEAQMSCNQSYRELRVASVYRESFEAIRDLNNEITTMAAILGRLHEVGPLEIMAQVLNISMKADEYFQKAGIEVKRDTNSIDVPNANGGEPFKMVYPVYQMFGSRTGDQFSRMMYGAQTHPKLKDYPPVFVFDPFYLVNFGRAGMRGHFRPDVKAVVIGPHVLSMDTAGVTSIFRHELQHYIESVKVDRGEMSLQRIQMADPGETSGKNYADQMSVDEAETHLRDLRSGNQNRIARIDKALGERIEPQFQEAIRSERIKMHGIEVENVDTIIKGTKEVLPVLFELAYGRRWEEIETDEKTGRTYVLFKSPNTDYKIVGVNVKGLATAQSSPSQIQDVVVKVLNWTQVRINQVEAELKKYNQKEE